MKIEGLLCLVGYTALSLAACATTPQERYADSIKAARAADRPVVVYSLDGMYGVAQIAQKPPKYANVYYAGVAFINSDPKPLQELTFTLGASFDYRPVRTADGKPLRFELSAKGPFAPGAAAGIVAGLSLSKAEAAALGGACLQLEGIRVTYADQTTFDVSAPHAGAYVTPQVQPQAICTAFAPLPGSRPRPPPFPPLPYYGQFESQYVHIYPPGSHDNRGRSATAPPGKGRR